MERQRIFNAERYLTKDFNFIEDAKEHEIANRTIDLNTLGIVRHTLTTTGFVGPLRKIGSQVLGEFAITANATNPTTAIDVGFLTGAPDPTLLTGLSYDGLGNRISIFQNLNFQTTTAPNPIPAGQPPTITRSSGNVNINMPFSGVGAAGDNFIWIEYLQINDLSKNSISKDKFGVIQLSRLLNGYKIIVTNTNIPPTSTTASILLGKVHRDIILGIQLPADISGRVFSNHRAEDVEIIIDSTKKPTLYQDQEVASLEDHINAVDTNPISPSNPHGTTPAGIGAAAILDLVNHRKEQHQAGIITNDPTARTTITSSFFPSLAGSTIIINNIVSTGAGEEAYAEGQRLLHSNISTAMPALTDRLVNAFNFNPPLGNTFVFDFNAGGALTKPANDYYIFYLNGTGTLAIAAVGIDSTLTPGGGPPPPAVITAINNLENLGKLVIVALKWTQGGPQRLIGITQAFNPVLDPVPAPTDLREFGSIGSKDLEPADGTSAQDVTTGFGVKTNHIQDAAVSAAKLAFTARSANKAVIVWAGLHTVSLRDSNQSGLFGYNMDGFYSQWVGGYVKVGSNGIIANNPEGPFRLNADSLPSAVLPAVLGTGGNDLDAGIIPILGNNWYAVMAVEQRALPTPFFKLKFVTFFKSNNAGVAGPSVLNASAHNVNASSPINYGWTAGDYAGGQALVLTGTSKGKILNITANGASSITVSDGTGISPLDYLMLAPAQTLATLTPNGFIPNNFRYLGAVYLDGAANIRQFVKKKDVYDFVSILVVASVVSGFVSLDGASSVSVVPPTAIQVGGICAVPFNFSRTGQMNSGGATFGNYDSGATQSIGALASVFQSVNFQSQLTAISAANLTVSYNITGGVDMPFPLTDLDIPNNVFVADSISSPNSAPVVFISRFRE